MSQSSDHATPLAKLFGDTPKVKLLATFIADPDFDYNVTDVANHAGVSRKTVYDHIDDLVEIGVVERTRETGRSQHYQLAEDSGVARLLAELESELIVLPGEE